MKHPIKNILVTFLLLLLWVYLGFSQNLKFNKVTPVDGDNFGAVTAITQDKNGFIWFATKTGIYKYDGSQLISFANDLNNSNSLASNNVLSLSVDDNGYVWAGTGNMGLDLYQPETGIFTHFRHDPNDPSSISNDSINSILRDQEGILWIATHQGLDQFDPATNSFIHFKSIKKDSTTLSSNQIRVLYEDKQGTLWIGTGSVWPGDGGGPEGGGLNRYNRETGTFTRFKHKANNINSLISNKISSIYEDNKGVLWIGTGRNGLHKMNRETGTFERVMYDPINPEKFSGPEFTKDSPPNECITFINQDVAGNYWLGTYASGLFYFNPKLGKIVKYQRPNTNSTGFQSIGSRSIFTSSDGILWIGGVGQGHLYRIDPLHKELPNNLISGAPVSSFYEEPDGILWIGTANGLLRIDRKNNDTIKYNSEINPLKTTTNYISTIKRDLQGKLWIGSENGLHYWDENNNKFVNFHHNPKDRNSISNNDVTDILEDSKNNFWITTSRGLNLLDRKTGKFKSFFISPTDSSARSNGCTSILEDKYGKLWIGLLSGKGVQLFNYKTKTFKSYLNGLPVNYIFEDSDGTLWISSWRGLYKYNRNSDNFIRYRTTFSTIEFRGLRSIVEDNKKYLWLGTRAGIVRINPQRNSTSVFGEKYGIADNSLSWRSVYKGFDGDIYFGNRSGYYKIDPEEKLRNLNPPQISIIGFRLGNQTINSDKNGPLKDEVQKTKLIKLKHSQNVFSFDFTIIDYINPKENRLSYFLENYDKAWIKSNNDRRAYYFNVPPGKYVFRVQGTNSNGVLAEKIIDIIIYPPWYRTWLAYAIYTLLFIAAIFGFNGFMRNRILEIERQKVQKRELEQAKEIEKAYTKLKATQSQLIQSEKMASLGELTAGIAHEIQNPLNFVNNFSEVNAEMIDEMQEELKAGEIEEAISISNNLKANELKIIHHGRRAESIVKGMLQHSRASSGKKEPTDINALADEYLRLSYHGLRAKDKSFNADFKMEADETLPKISVIPQDIGRVLLNLINNAFYAVSSKTLATVDQGYKPEVVVSTFSFKSPSGDLGVKITVKDNGSGIPENIKPKIFQPFFTTKPTGSGTGLGLSLSYDIIKAHGGDIRVESTENIGTAFIITFPYNNSQS